MYVLRMMLLRVWAVGAVIGFITEFVIMFAFASAVAQARTIPNQSEQPAAVADVSSETDHDPVKA